MKAGVRAIGIAESFRGDRSTLAGVVVRADRVLDGVALGSCTVGGTDATAAVIDLFERLGREDGQYVLVAGIAPAWYNILDLNEIRAAVDRPVLAVTFEDSEGLEPALRDAFEGATLEHRLQQYRAQPPREEVVVNDESVFVRAVGVNAEKARDVVRAFTPMGGRPEPLRLARLIARAADQWRPATKPTD